MAARAIRVAAIVALFLGVQCAWANVITEQELKTRVVEATKGFSDLTMTGTITYKNKKSLEKLDPAYARLYDFKSASVSFKDPDKMRMDGKLGMVRFEYIINGSKKIFRAPSIRVSKKEDYPDDPAKTQHALDIGLVTASLWNNRRVEVQDDPEAAAANEIKLRLYWPKGDMIYLVWLDSRDLYLKRFEKRDAQSNLRVRAVYCEPRKVDNVVWIPTKVEVYGPDGEKAGASEMTDIKVNTGLADTLFQ